MTFCFSKHPSENGQRYLRQFHFCSGLSHTQSGITKPKYLERKILDNTKYCLAGKKKGGGKPPPQSTL
jgi:hypothetical protein